MVALNKCDALTGDAVQRTEKRVAAQLAHSLPEVRAQQSLPPHMPARARAHALTRAHSSERRPASRSPARPGGTRSTCCLERKCRHCECAASATGRANSPTLSWCSLRTFDRWRSRVSTSKLNRWLREVTRLHSPVASHGTRRIRIKFATQARTRPPTFVLFTSRSGLAESYQRCEPARPRSVPRAHRAFPTVFWQTACAPSLSCMECPCASSSKRQRTRSSLVREKAACPWG